MMHSLVDISNRDTILVLSLEVVKWWMYDASGIFIYVCAMYNENVKYNLRRKTLLCISCYQKKSQIRHIAADHPT